LFNCIQYKGEKYFDLSNKTIAVHIRSINPQDNCYNPNRELYSESKRDYFLCLLQNIKDNHDHNEKLDIHIFSQGNPKYFDCFEEIHDAKLHINDNLVNTFYHLITANILLTSNSSMSWAAHLYGQNKLVYSRDNFFHSWYPSTKLVDYYGNLK
jgi:hypothetical protein